MYDQHIRRDAKGNLKGVYVVNPKAIRVAKGYGDDPYWQAVDQIIAAYSRVNILEMQQHAIENKAERDAIMSKFGESKRGLRRLVSLPVGLMMAIEKFDPFFFGSKDKVRKLARRYTFLRVAPKI